MSNKEPTNMPKSVLVDTDKISRVEEEGDYFEIGQWYWVTTEIFDSRESYIVPEFSPQGFDDLVCVTKVGSNYVEVSQIKVGNGYGCCRIHFNEITEENCVFEPNPHSYFQKFAGFYQQLTLEKMKVVAQITKDLNLSNTKDIAAQTSLLSNDTENIGSISTSIVPIGLNIDSLKANLIATKEVKLPAIKDEIKKTNDSMAGWLSAPSMTAKAMLSLLDNTMVTINDKIEDVSLYAGVGEGCVIVKEGLCASGQEKVTLMQRRCYMDEECLVDYLSGGIDIDKIDVFDDWISKKENMERILPFEKCIVAFRVRRKTKYYGSSNTGMANYIRATLDRENKSTYLYIRNGQQLSRINTLIDFDEMLFENDAANIAEPLMAKRRPEFSEVPTMPVGEYEFLIARKKELGVAADKWELSNPSDDQVKHDHFGSYKINGVAYNPKNPHLVTYRNERLGDFRSEQWKLLDSDHLYFDDVRAEQEALMRKYNKIAIIIQGLMDRSTALSPIPKYDLSKQHDFSMALRLVFDKEMVLTYGDEPSFEAYQHELNAQADADSIWVGQLLHWQLVTAEKEQRKEDRKEYGQDLDPYRLSVNGNSGPKLYSASTRLMKTAEKATFSWEFRSEANRSYGEMKAAKISAPFAALLNISAYQKGDYKRFFMDPRSRHKYIKWAPYLLAAEEYVMRNEI